MDLTELPNDIFLLIIDHLSPAELVLCRSISKRFFAAFTQSDLSRHALELHYPRARELRTAGHNPVWSDIFANVAARYQNLRSGNPSHIEKLPIGKSFVVPKWARYYPVATWHQHLQFEEKTAPFHYPDPLWTYDEGLLIFPSSDLQAYGLYDLNSGKLGRIDIESEDKVVRRIRLKENVLVIEWCEPDAYHQLNENEIVYRHFATAYDIIFNLQTGNWDAVFRSRSCPISLNIN